MGGIIQDSASDDTFGDSADAIDGTDLLMLESPDEGASWEPLRGLKKNH